MSSATLTRNELGTRRHVGKPARGALLPADRRRHAAVVLVRSPAGPRLDRAAGVSHVPRLRHQDRRALLSRPGAVELQVPLVAADGPLRPALRPDGAAPLVDPGVPALPSAHD